MILMIKCYCKPRSVGGIRAIRTREVEKKYFERLGLYWDRLAEKTVSQNSASKAQRRREGKQHLAESIPDFILHY